MHRDLVAQCLELETVGDDAFRALSAGWPGADWAYGGLIIAQVGLAARATGGGRDLRSVTVSFVSSTDPSRPVDLGVERIADHGTFANRVVRVSQGGQVRALATVLLHHFEEGPLHQVPMPAVVGPDAAASGQPGLPVVVRDASAGRLMSGAVADPEICVWYDVGELAGDQARNEAMVGFISDLTMLETAWRPVPNATIRYMDRVISSTLSHTTWYHQPVPFDDWVLFHAQSPRAAGGRSLCHANLFTIDGVLVASVAQEGLMRFRGGAG